MSMTKWEVCNEIYDLEILKDNFEDLRTVYVWNCEGWYKTKQLNTKQELTDYGLTYTEQRIAHEQIQTLLGVYIERFEVALKQLSEYVNSIE